MNEQAYPEENRDQAPAENKMGTMPVGKLLFQISFPIIISMIIQALYNVVDSMYVSRINEQALTAVSLVYPMQTLMISVALGTNVGVNALLSLGYSLLAADVTSALETVGLDPCVGFLHRDRPGRPSLALDLMEELRAYLVDRFVLSLINLRKLRADDFDTRENGAVSLTDTARKEAFLQSWQTRTQEEITHPYLNEKIPLGLLPYVQATLLARAIRGDLDGYPPFFLR